jgi:hypothetical protein
MTSFRPIYSQPRSRPKRSFLRNKPISLVNTAPDTAPGRPSLILHRGCRALDAVPTAIREGIDPPTAASRSPTLLSGRETVLEDPILGLPATDRRETRRADRLPRNRPHGTPVPADGPGDGADAGARSCAGNRRCWVRVMSAQAVTGTTRAASSSNFVHGGPQSGFDQRDGGQG